MDGKIDSINKAIESIYIMRMFCVEGQKYGPIISIEPYFKLIGM
jgi:hypothetical protein